MDDAKSKKLKETIESFMGDKVTVIDEDTDFYFKCDGCRDGSSSCCCNRSNNLIIVSPYDIYKLQKGLGKTTFEIINKYMKLIHGSDSGIPLFVLKSKIIHTGEEICMFLKKKLNEDGTGRRYCSVHEFKPGACAMFPLGRMQDNESEKVYYFLQDINCGLKPTENDAPLRIRNMMPDLDNGNKAFIQYGKFISELHKIIDFRKVLDSELMPGTLKELLVSVYLGALYDFEENEDFFEQFERNSKRTIDVIEQIAEEFHKYDSSIKVKH